MVLTDRQTDWYNGLIPKIAHVKSVVLVVKFSGADTRAVIGLYTHSRHVCRQSTNDCATDRVRRQYTPAWNIVLFDPWKHMMTFWSRWRHYKADVWMHVRRCSDKAHLFRIRIPWSPQVCEYAMKMVFECTYTSACAATYRQRNVGAAVGDGDNDDLADVTALLRIDSGTHRDLCMPCVRHVCKGKLHAFRGVKATLWFRFPVIQERVFAQTGYSNSAMIRHLRAANAFIRATHRQSVGQRTSSPARHGLKPAIVHYSYDKVVCIVFHYYGMDSSLNSSLSSL